MWPAVAGHVEKAFNNDPPKEDHFKFKRGLPFLYVHRKAKKSSYLGLKKIKRFFGY